MSFFTSQKKKGEKEPPFLFYRATNGIWKSAAATYLHVCQALREPFVHSFRGWMWGEAICSWSALSHAVFKEQHGACSQVAAGRPFKRRPIFVVLRGEINALSLQVKIWSGIFLFLFFFEADVNFLLLSELFDWLQVIPPHCKWLIWSSNRCFVMNRKTSDI